MFSPPPLRRRGPLNVQSRVTSGLHGVRRGLHGVTRLCTKTTIPVRKDVQRVGKNVQDGPSRLIGRWTKKLPRKVCPERAAMRGRRPDLWLGFPFGSRSSRSGRAGREELFVLGETHVVDEVGVCSIGQRADFLSPQPTS